MLRASEVDLGRGVRGVTIENDRISVTLLPDKGADIYQWVHKRTGVDVLWKSPWGLRRPGAGIPTSFDSSVTWMEWYPGGWQVLFPSGGGPVTYKGVELSFHGEASAVPWDIDDLGSDERAAWLRLSTRLARSPFALERTIELDHDASSFLLRETVRNDGGEPMDYMWGHHPAFGAPFLSDDCRIDTNARHLVADDAYDPPSNPIETGQTYEWPHGARDGDATDLSIVPGESASRATLGYFDGYGEIAWYGITNSHLGIGAGLAWRREDFPHAWFWQEMHASPSFPWYKGAYVMAIEPNTTWPGQGLVAAMEKTGTHRVLQPGESRTAEIRAVLYDSSTGIGGIDMDGTVHP
ncbi:MAG: aldose 1-epimerase [Thermomicrobiales bacterium]|nr:aldose 1-epimerase [Thermomicrobiales bacterium]MCO5220949.1 aldose 1-epimerase [Thermomicrobiales bacterium]